MYNMALENNITSKVIGIQFSLMSPEEIYKNSVAEIKYKETYNGNKPKTGGLFDMRMGTLEPGVICPTDNLNHTKCPGYFGHIQLEKPVYYIQYLNTIQQILEAVCFKCSKLLLNKNDYTHFNSLNNIQRWNKVHSLCKEINRCGINTYDGCNCRQPDKIKKEDFATLIAEWSATSDMDKTVTIKLTPSHVQSIFKKISDEDVDFMGFSSKWSRPEWMICSIFAVPPPSIRPSVKVDSQQRSEDDLTHILVNIVKYNNSLKEQILNKGNTENWESLLQYYIACLTDNNISGAHPVTQRSGRPLKSISERHKGKTGRVRGNLMGKRVDYSARSVITPDPELSITELGVPMKIAMNITKPVYVNNKNKKYLLYLVHNGPSVYPGAKILEKKSGENISLRYINRDTINLEVGDIVHRHMLDGDCVLFNRQPTLHRMSMMAHIVKVLSKGDTFRMNVAVTKPYNADFDGDEMNMHMPQNDEAETELKNLASIPNQIIGPGNSSSIIGIFQDSLLGSYLFTDENVKFDRNEAINLVSKTYTKNFDIFKNKSKNTFTPQEIINSILPKITTTHNKINIINGELGKGQIDKSFYGGKKGIIQRLYNDISPERSQEFIDDIQQIITEYMRKRGFSVGISDLIADDNTSSEIKKIIVDKKQKVLESLESIKLGLFENNTHKSNREVFEYSVNNILNQATQEAGKCGLTHLDKDNRFVKIVASGSKGSAINIGQMISCVGQQSIDNQRIPHNFNNRTLPHYTQFDESMEARGFVENSFIEGLTPEEMFFHAMSGRVGLIDTAVKTSTTGYIQRRLIKGMEDFYVAYDGTVRNNKDKIVQFKYGAGSDTIFMEPFTFELIEKTSEEIFELFSLPLDDKTIKKVFIAKKANSILQDIENIKKYNKKIILDRINDRDHYIINVNKHVNDNEVYSSVNFKQIIKTILNKYPRTNKKCDMSISEFYNFIDKKYDYLQNVFEPCYLFKSTYYYYLNAKYLLYDEKINKDILEYILETIILKYKRSIINPGEMVGLISAQSIGEPTTQMTLNTFHFAGVASKANVTRGVPRMEELLTLTSKIKNPSATIFLKQHLQDNKEYATNLITQIEHTKLSSIVDKCEIYYEPAKYSSETIYEDDLNIAKEYRDMISIFGEEICDGESLKFENKWVLRITFNKSVMNFNNITVQFIHYALKKIYGDEISCLYSDMSEENIIFKIKINKNKKSVKKNIDESDNIWAIKAFQDNLLETVAIRGISGITNVTPRCINAYKVGSKKENTLLHRDEDTLDFKSTDIWVLDTAGSNLKHLLRLPDIDATRTYSNNIIEMKEVLGIEACRKCLFDEIVEVMTDAGSFINPQHIDLLVDRMCYNDKLVSIYRHGINNDNIGPIAKASFEETTEMFLRAAKHGELDEVRGVSANIMCGQDGYYGTSAFDVYINNNELINKNTVDFSKKNSNVLDKLYSTKESDIDKCDNISIKHNLKNIPVEKVNTQQLVDLDL